MQTRLERVEKRLDDHDKLIANMPFVYVTKEDFIRAISSISATISENQKDTNAKLDKIYDLMLQSKEGELTWHISRSKRSRTERCAAASCARSL